MTFKPTEAQQRIYQFVENGTGNGIIDAVAGVVILHSWQILL